MKKIFIILAFAFIGFTSCEKKVEEIESNATVTRIACGYCGSNNIQVFYPPSSHSHLPPSYTCNVCGKGGTLYPN